MERDRRGLIVAQVGILLIAGTFVAGALTAPTSQVGADGDRQTLVGSQSTGGGWHHGGSVYMMEGGTVTWREDSADSYFDVTMLENGSVMAGFMHGGYQDGCAPYAPPCAKTGFKVIDPNAAGGPSVVSEYSFPVRSRTNSEVHDVEQLDSGEYLLSDMDKERIFTVKDGEVTWEWRASSFYEAPEDPTRRDWLHVNDVDAVNQTHYLVSVRNANQLVLVERGEGVVEVVNEDDGGSDDSCLKRGQLVDADGDGDVRCGDPSVLNHQHNPQWLDEGAVLVADSDNDRAVELHENETTGTWEPAWTLRRADGMELHWPRDADRLSNGNTLITDTHNKRIIEVTENGTTVWSGDAFAIPYEAERLPEGEAVGGERYAASDGAGEDVRGGEVPVLTTALFGLKGALPMIPVWFGELHLALVVVGLLGVIGGGVEWWRGRGAGPSAGADETTAD